MFAFDTTTITLERERQLQFLQLPIASEKGDYSKETAREIDCEVRRIIDEQDERVRRFLKEKKAVLQQGAKLLIDREVITGAELKAIIDVEAKTICPEMTEGGSRLGSPSYKRQHYQTSSTEQSETKRYGIQRLLQDSWS